MYFAFLLFFEQMTTVFPQEPMPQTWTAILIIFLLASVVSAQEVRAAPIPPHKVGENVPLTNVCWSTGAGEIYRKTLTNSADQATVFHFENVQVVRPHDISLCAGSICRANQKAALSFWSVPIVSDRTASIDVIVQGPSSGCITELAKLKQTGRLRNHAITLGCSTNTDDNIPTKCTAAQKCSPLPQVYSRAAAVASILYQAGTGWYVCTAWLSSNAGHVFTNNHCVSSQKSASSIEFYFGCELECPNTEAVCNYASSATNSSKCHLCDLNSSYNVPCYSQPNLGPHASGAMLLRTDAVLDYTLLKIKTPDAIPCISDPACPMRLVPAGFAIANPKVFMFHHSAGLPKVLSYFDSPSPGHDTTGRMAIRAVVSAGCYARDLTYDADIVGGSSGSVVALAPDYCDAPP